MVLGEFMTASRFFVANLLKAGCLFATAVVMQPVMAAHDPDDVAITLARSACYGACPAYTVTIHGDGLVHFTTGTPAVGAVDTVHRQFARSNGVLFPGTHEDRIPPEAVDALRKRFEAVGFWHLKDAYRASAWDIPTQVLTLVIGGKKKTVVDYMGTEAGMPQAVKDLEVTIDRVADTDRWVKGSPALIPWLEQTGFDFHSNYAAALAVAGEENDADEATVIGFVDRGAPLSQAVLPQGNIPSETEIAGVTLLESSIKRGHANLFKRLLKDGWLSRLGKTKAAEIFASTSAGCSPSMVDAAADAGIDIDFALAIKDSDDAEGKTALTMLPSAYACIENERARVQTAVRLLARGANPNHRDSLGRTPLYGVENLQLLDILLSHGADASATSMDGQSMLFGSWTDAIVLRLLEAGASPVGRYDDGKTLAQQAKARHMPHVANWLIKHPEAFHR